MKLSSYALLANTASFGYHWVYDPVYLKELAQKESLLFTSPNINHYQIAKSAYFGYPFGKKGDVTTQGMMLKWLFDATKLNPEFSSKDFAKLLYEKMQPGGEYVGYVETYTQKLILNMTIDRLRLDIPKAQMTDDHLVGFVPYFVAKDLNLSNEWAWEQAQLFTNRHEYMSLYQMFDSILQLIPEYTLVDAIKKSLNLAPESMEAALVQAVEMSDTTDFIKSYAGIACSIPQSIPLILHLLAMEKDFISTLQINTELGGASSERGMLLGAILSKVYPVDTTLFNHLNVHVE